jgi:hypothetical protein
MIDSPPDNSACSPSQWWESKRFRYNKIMLCAAPISFFCLFLVWWIFEDKLPCLEITGFSIVFGCIFFFICLGVANIFYLLGPLLESLIRPHSTNSFRLKLFMLGTGFSLFLIFLPVIGNLVSVVTYSSDSPQCD